MRIIFLLSIVFLSSAVSADDCIHEKVKNLEKRIEVLEKNRLVMEPLQISTSTNPFIYFGMDNQVNPVVYHCLKCGKTFKQNQQKFKTSCAVIHNDGCCHYGEEEVR